MTARSVVRRIAEAARETAYPYPWRALEADLARAGRDALPLVAYGSLVNPDSAAHTLGERSARFRRPVVAYGLRRVFDVALPADHPRYGPPADPHAIAALNVRVTGVAEDSINGVLLHVSLEDLPALREREEGYDLHPVACSYWDDPDDDGGLAYVLVAPVLPGEPPPEPHRRYYAVCRAGAAGMGPAFLAAWLRTTYLADGVTPVEQWERQEPRR